MTLLLICLALLLAGAAACALPLRSGVIGPYAATGAAVLASVAGFTTLITGAMQTVTLPVHLPFDTLRLGLDPLSALFVLLIGVIGALAAVYGRGYLAGQDRRKTALSWCWYNLLVAAMLLVVLARTGFIFLVAWEVMSLASFFLVVHDHEKSGVLRAGWIYLIATHLGTAFLLVMFLLLGRDGSLDFAHLAAAGVSASLVFALALVGFGTKAGFVPLHVWLPEAHPVAPSHVSALMSGVMIKIGLYGLLRVLTFLGPPPAGWGWTLVSIGAVTGLTGVLFALAQHDLKRLLAYSSVENVGIIALALGMGLLGIAAGDPVVSTLGICAALLHVVNHALFKSLLFFGAGAVIHATGTDRMDRLGGLLRLMPRTGTAFLVGAAAISALPPLNGFISEFLVYAAAFKAVSAGTHPWSGLVAVAGLALIGGLAAACFAKAFGIVFLGAPRSAAAVQAHEASLSMNGVMVLLAVLCVMTGLGGLWMVRWVAPAASQLLPPDMTTDALQTLFDMLGRIGYAALALIACAAGLYGLRTALLRRREVRQDETWGCGYVAPTARMQYSASSFVQPIGVMFAALLRTRHYLHAPHGLFPTGARLHTDTPDVFVQSLFAPALRVLVRLAAAFRDLQQGRTHQCILYIVATLLLLLIWHLG
ncbi:MAG: hypothetical protein VR64_09835 [Desulfatitalea sp. BRH_c12]|nr:MAG: hypothetical protein VR64_09835 [Desulfatitalea sp. BRH_c12]